MASTEDWRYRSHRISQAKGDAELSIAFIQERIRSTLTLGTTPIVPSLGVVTDCTMHLGRAKISVAALLRELRGIQAAHHFVQVRLNPERHWQLQDALRLMETITDDRSAEMVSVSSEAEAELARERDELKQLIDRLLADIRTAEPIVHEWRRPYSQSRRNDVEVDDQIEWLDE